MGSSVSKSVKITVGSELCALSSLPPAFALHLAYLDVAHLRRLIRKGRLAPMPPMCAHNGDAQSISSASANDDAPSPEQEGHDCPICCVAFSAPQNHASCCGAHLCTQCFVLHQVASDTPGQAPCPFCKAEPFAVQYFGGALPAKQKQQQQKQQQQGAGSRQRAWQVLLLSRRCSASEPGSSPDAVSPTATAPGAASYALRQRQQQQDQQRQSGPGFWLQQLTSSSSRRRVESISVLAGFSHDGSPQPADAADAAGVSAQAHNSDGNTAEHGAAAVAAATAEQRLLQLAELSQLADAGLLPAYAAVELAGLHPEELEEILLEQALLASLRGAGPGQQAGSRASSSASSLGREIDVARQHAEEGSSP